MFCKDCKYWLLTVPNVPWYIPGFLEEEEGEDNLLVRKIINCGTCNLAEMNLEEDNSKRKLMALDRECYQASLLTRPDFGCNQFKLKE